MKNFDIVIQGPVYEPTFNLIEEYKDLSFVNRIIVSTWNEWREVCNRINYDNIDIVISDEIPYSGAGNRNKQVISTLNGLRACNSEYVIKIRSDMLWIEESMYQMKDFFHEYKNCNIKRLDDKAKPFGRVFCAGIYDNFPFHPFDCMFWGYKQDVIDLFDIPLSTFNSFQDKTRTETYIASHYYAKFDQEAADMLKRPDLYLCDDSPYFRYATKLSRSLGSKILKPFPKSIMKMIWYKQSFTNYYDWDLRTYQDGLWFHEHDKSDEK